MCSLFQGAILFCLLTTACKMKNEINSLPRNQSLPLFQPHAPVSTFTCEIEAMKIPIVDAQAAAWFAEAIKLDDPNIYYENLDCKRITELTRKAAERHHWKAMINLASLYLEGRDPPHGTQDALKIIEDAMRLGIPAAYDRMGTYFMNGTGVDTDATRAYAFWQKAAYMGSPEAMTFLEEKLFSVPAMERPGEWSNKPLGKAMLQCAFGQGYGPAARDLAAYYILPAYQNPTREEKALALRILHEGVKLGCEDCANNLSIEFSEPENLADTLVPFIDKARAKRYDLLGDALGFDPRDRFPNLDKILPLPPAKLPPWNGDRDTLLSGARGVSPPPSVPKPTAASGLTKRHFLDAAFLLRPSGQTSRNGLVPLAGYWRPTAEHLPELMRTRLTAVPSRLYQQGEPFELFPLSSAEGWGYMKGVLWQHLLTIDHHLNEIQPRAAAGLTRTVARPVSLSYCKADAMCPITGTWQPWVHNEHPMVEIVNGHWRQKWLLAGQPFPHPQRDWLLELPASDVSWHLMDDAPVNINQ